MSTAMTGRPLRFRISVKEKKIPLRAPRKPVPKRASTTSSASLRASMKGALLRSPSLLRSRGPFKDFRISMFFLAIPLEGEPEETRKVSTRAFRRMRCLARAKPSPPLFPGPQRTITAFPLREPNFASMAATMEREAFSIKRISGIPNSSAPLRSTRWESSTERIIFPPLSLFTSILPRVKFLFNGLKPCIPDSVYLFRDISGGFP